MGNGKQKLKGAAKLATVALVLAASSVLVKGATSPNFETLHETSPAAAGDAFSPNYHLVGVAPQEASGDVRVSNNYELETIFVPPTFEPIDTTPPVIQSGPNVTYISHASVLVEWTTDEPTDGDVEYGQTTSYGNIESQQGGFSTFHQVIVTGLTPNTTYNYRVGSSDVYANGPTFSANSQFTTSAAPDTSPPVITETVNFVATTVAEIAFTTDEPATSEVEHGPNAGLGTSLPDDVFRTSHSRTVSSIPAGGTWFYEVTATDPQNNTSTTSVQSFTMPEEVLIDAPPPLPNGKEGSTFLYAGLTATGGVGALTWTIDSGALPTGISIDGATGEISGVPVQTGGFNFDVRATDSGSPASSDVVSLQMTVGQADSGDGRDDGGDDGCSTGEGRGGWMLIAALLSLMVLAGRRIAARES